MKKSNPSNQKTLFQSWGKQSTSKPKTIPQDTRQNNGFDPLEIVDLGDDDEDDGLLAAAMEMEAIDYATNDRNIDPQTSISSHVSMPGNSESQSKEIEILPGFDMESGNIWIYPTNYPVRDYQFKIVEKALFINTLVTLPTGLGKTFIAAVLMYNYYRWYPQGKIIFMAPTKPLVAQQIEACYNIMGIPESDTAQMTGTIAPSKREIMWKSQRVFFLTPQVLQNDLGRGSCNAEQVVLLVFDEAHKALGNHAYCQVIREIYSYTRKFRVLALSATPGDDIKAVQQVMTNLLISHMELRSEDSPDIQAYTHSRTIDKIVVPLGEEIKRIKTQFLKVLDGIVGRLFCNKAIWQKEAQRVTKFMLLSGRAKFRERDNEGYTNGQKGAIESDFAMAISLYHAYELLHQHGILSFYNFIKAIIDGTKGMARAKTEMRRHTDFMEVMDDLRQSIERPPDDMSAETSALFSQFTSPRRRSMMREAFDPSFRSHPKLLRLEEVIVDHFQKFGENASTSTSTDNANDTKTKPSDVNTRVMIFSQYRDSVGEITAILNKHKPLVQVMSFIGQASTGKSSRGLTQKEQLEVVQRFRQGGYNTLVATCVGEEGLDIGDVDLIVCFDAHASPIRLVQRMGRTGRKRNGRIVVLVSEGKEEQVYKRSLSSKKSIHKAIVQGSKSFEFYDENPRMIPRHLTPRPHKMEMTVGKFVGNTKRKRTSEPNETKGTISNFLSKSTSSKSSTSTRKDDGLLTYEELVYWQENFKLPDCEAGTTPLEKRRSHSSVMDPPVKELSLNEWMPWQNVPSPVHRIAHSRRTEHLIEILEFVELHSGEDDAYDVEMMSFLNEQDLVGVDDESDKNNDDAPLIILDDEDDNIIKLGNGKERKKNENPKKKKQKPTDENRTEDTKKKSESSRNSKQNKSKKSKDKKVSPQRKWKEYLKTFENEDDDFEPVDKDSSTDEQDNHDETETSCQQETTEKEQAKEVKTSVSDSPPGNRLEGDSISPVNIPEENEDDDPLEISSQSFSQLLPSMIPHNAHIFRSKVLGMEKIAKDVPLPPSLDSLNEIGPFTPTKSAEPFEEECRRRRNQNRIEACRKNIQKDSEEEETEPAIKSDFVDRRMKSEKMGFEKNETWDLGNDFSPIRKQSKPVIDEAPDIFEFDNCNNEFLEDDEILEFGNKESSEKLDKDLSGVPKVRKDSILDEPPTTFEFEESGGDKIKDNGKANAGIENKDLGNDLSARQKSQKSSEIMDAPETKHLDESMDLLESKYTTPKKDSSSVFGAGVICNSGTKTMDDDIEIAFGDDSLTDGLLAEFVDEDLTADAHCLSTNSKDNNFSKDVTSSGDETDKGSKTEAKNADKSDSFKASFSKISTFEINTRNEESPSKSKNPNQSHDSISNTIKDSCVSKNLGPKTMAECTLMSSTDDVRKRDEFQFKKPNALMVNRFPKSPSSSGLTFGDQRYVTGGNAQTSPLRTKSVSGVSSKLSLKRNTSQRHEKDNRVVEKLSSQKQNENEPLLTMKNENSCNLIKRCIEDDRVREENQALSKSTNDLEDSPLSTQWKLKPLRERIGATIASPNSHKIDEKSQRNNEEGDSPIVRKRPRSKNAPIISSPSCLSPDASITVDVKDEESPIVRRRRSKIKKKNGNVVAIAESDDDEEVGVNPTGIPTAFVKSAQPTKAERECRVDMNNGRHGRLPQSDSDEEFLGVRHKPENVKRAAIGKRKIQLQPSMKRKRMHSRVPSKKQRIHHINQFLDEEAELSGSDIEDFSDEESDYGDEFDSFIDDATQLTQRTPTQAITKNHKSRPKMDDIYRQSLISPLARDLNFRTPTLCRNKNKYKMKYKPGTIGEESASEAEETYERESDLENELSFDSQDDDYSEECDTEPEDDDDDDGGDGDEDEECIGVGALQNRETTPYAASQIRRPRKNVKRKRILNDSMDEDSARVPSKTTPSQSPKVPSLKSRLTREIKNGPQNTSVESAKQPSFVPPSSLYTAENHTHANHTLAKVPPTRECEQQKTTPKWNFNQKSSLSSTKVKNSKPKANENLSTAFEIDWGIDFSDLDLLDAMEDTGDVNNKPCLSKNETKRESSKYINVCDQEMQEIAFAMASTDDDVDMMSEMPTFSLGFDLFGDLEDEDDTLDTNTDTTTTTADDCIITSSTNNPPKRPRDANSELKFTKIVSPKRSSDGEFGFNRTVQSTVPLKKNNGVPQNIHNNNLTKDNGSVFETRKETTNIPLQTNRLSLVERPTTSTTANKTISSRLAGDKGSCLRSSGTTGLKDITNWNVTTPSGTTKTIPTAFVSPSQKDKGKLVILVDTKEISNSQVVSVLRRKHNIKAEVCQLMHCDYVVSNRMGVVRKLASAVGNGTNSTKILNKIRILCDLYERPSFIIEKDRVKPGETERDYSRSNTYVYTLACMAQTHIKVLFSESQEETASLLTDLATLEAKKNVNIVVPLTMNKETQQVFRFLLTIPSVSYVTALNLCSSLRTLRDLITSSPEDLQKTSRQLTESRATDICTYVKHLFDETMVYKDTKKNA